ncbi:MAG: hypothetical protein GY799_28330, partial [Desulfobulbaceae bacterium]|nr:hypothetical protein [Desulfobulbaceae bacterium]
DVTAVNDAPVLTGDLAATVNEGAAYTLTGTDLGYSDLDDVDADVAFTTSSAVNGRIQVNGLDASSFTGTQLTAGQVTFIHDGSETVAAAFDVNVEDGNEDLSAPSNSPFNLTITLVNDNASVITANQRFSLAEDADNDVAVGTVLATDADTIGSLQNWMITAGNGDGIFAIHSVSGAITVADTTNLDWETTHTYHLWVTVGDGTHTSAAEMVTVDI